MPTSQKCPNAFLGNSSHLFKRSHIEWHLTKGSSCVRLGTRVSLTLPICQGLHDRLKPHVPATDDTQVPFLLPKNASAKFATKMIQHPSASKFMNQLRTLLTLTLRVTKIPRNRAWPRSHVHHCQSKSLKYMNIYELYLPLPSFACWKVGAPQPD